MNNELPLRVPAHLHLPRCAGRARRAVGVRSDWPRGWMDTGCTSVSCRRIWCFLRVPLWRTKVTARRSADSWRSGGREAESWLERCALQRTTERRIVEAGAAGGGRRAADSRNKARKAQYERGRQGKAAAKRQRSEAICVSSFLSALKAPRNTGFHAGGKL